MQVFNAFGYSMCTVVQFMMVFKLCKCSMHVGVNNVQLFNAQRCSMFNVCKCLMYRGV